MQKLMAIGLFITIIAAMYSTSVGSKEVTTTGKTKLVDVRTYAPSIKVDAVYTTPNNFTGKKLPGYCENVAVLLPRAAKALAKVQHELKRKELGLKVWDAYRPVRATKAMVQWAVQTGNEEVVKKGYILPRSRHNLATTVDLTLVNLKTGKELEMGTPFDYFGEKAHTTLASNAVLKNRMLLKNAMEAHGFVNYYKEWWHFDSEQLGSKRLDVPVRCS